MTDRTYKNLEITGQLKTKELASANTRINNISSDNMYSQNANISNLSATNYFMQNAILSNLTATTLSATNINATTLTSTNMNLTNLSVTNLSTTTVTAQNIYNSNELNVMGNTNINKTIKGFKNFYDLTQPDNIDFDIITNWFDASVPLNITTTNNIITRVYDRYGTGYNVTPTPVDTYFTPLVSNNISYDTNKNGIYFNGGLSYFSATTIDSPASFCFFICYEQQDKSPNESIIASIFNNENKIFYNSSNIITTNNVNSTEIYKTYPSKLILAINNTGGTNYNVYINGIYSHSYSNSTARTDKLYIGNDSTGNASNNFKGWIYEAVLYKQALTEQQIGYITTYMNDKWNVYENRTIDIFTIAGEENALGVAYNAGVSPSAYTGLTKPDVGRYLDPQYYNPVLTKWKIASERFGTGTIDTTGSRGSAWGAFCQEYFKQTGREAWILYVAKPNTSLFNVSEWAPSNAGSNYIQRLLDIIDAAVSKINNTYLYNIGTKSIIWHQGETDRNRTKSEYTNAFLGMFDYVMNTKKYDKFFYYEICDGNTLSTENVRSAQRELYSYRSNLHLLFECSNFKAQGGLRTDTEFSYNVQSYETMGQQGAVSAASYILEKVNYYINTISVNKQLSFPNPSPSNPIIRFGTVTTTDILYNESINELKYSSTNANVTTNIMTINPTYTTFYNNLSLSKAVIYSLQTITTDTVLNKNTLVPIYIADTTSSNISLTLPNNFITSDIGASFQVIKTGVNTLSIRPPSSVGFNLFYINASTNPINVTTNYQLRTVTFGGISGFNNNFYLS